MHKPSVSQLVYKVLYPRARHNDPQNWSQHVTRHLVPEVRLETASFYGELNNIEAQYPGLDYAYKSHRQRLCRYPYHRRLFRAFDELHLTRNEILSLCQWEGTRSAKQKYEADSNTHIRDTTTDDMHMARPARQPIAIQHEPPEQSGSMSLTVAARGGSGIPDKRSAELMDLQDESEESGEDDSCGVQLNHHLQAAVEARSRGESVVLDEDFERFVRNMERNDTGMVDIETLIRMPNICPTNEPSNSASTANVAVSISQPTNLEWSLPRVASASTLHGSVPVLSTPPSSYSSMVAPASNPPAGEAR